MHLDGEYDEQNIFAKILRGEIPSAKVWEDEHCLVIMDAFPQTRGHCLVIPKGRARNLLDAPPVMLEHLVIMAQRTARAAVIALEADGVRLVQFNGSAAGQSVPHLHFHVIPMRSGEAMGAHGEGQADPEALNALAEAIAAEMA